ncbi:MAG: type IV pili methyl-accepting chemotaxis transducer N-terminal domain-containing protein [Betaproteobacteria bacterium]|nr:type IV pili methyl-accepting chemotaxis transducer N-terminal domain-containing protein [Betaproteobacteria bacterium]
MRRVTDALFERSILLWLAAAILTGAAIGVGGMMLSVLVAEQVQGSGSAINVAGSLRRLSHRMGSIVLSDAENQVSDHVTLRQAVVHFEATLKHDALTQTLARQPDGPFAATYQAVRETWERRLKPMLAEQMMPGPNLLPVTTHNRLLLQIDEFVDQLNVMVAQLEADTESRIRQLRRILLAALILTVVVLILGLYAVHRRVLKPLDTLLAGASRIAVGDFSARTLHVGQDELGRVGQSFNTMAEAVSRSHQDLENRVREKTAELTRSNRSLALLYNAIALLHNAPSAPDTYLAILAEIEVLLDVKGSMACLQAMHGGETSILAAGVRACGNRSAEGCAQCLEGAAALGERIRYQPCEGGHALTLPLRDLDGVYGVMRLSLPGERRLETWQEQLLQALTRHIGIALGMTRKLEQERLLALQEERSIIARELHDSIAQALSYMKIQASLLQPVLSDPERRQQAETVLADLREGISAAYRQLRELLATFRLKMEGDFLALLSAAVDEYSIRGDLPIHRDIRLADCRLSPNQEIHILQIVREALSNVLRHARATQAWVYMEQHAGGGVEVRIEDDGVGLARDGAQGGGEHFHYGLAIMRERAQGLRGNLELRERPGGGARVTLRFQTDSPPAIDPA